MRSSPLAGIALSLSLAALAALAVPSVARAQAAPGTVWPDEGPRTWTPRPTEPAITPDDLRTHVYQLADDSLEGRAAGAEGNQKATDYVAAQFRRVGLRPGGDGGTWFQVLPFGRVVFDRAAVRLIAAGTTLEPGADWAPIPTSGGLRVSGRLSVGDAPTVFGGRYGETGVALDAAAVRGRVVVFLAPEPGAPTDFRAQDAGAAAFLIVTNALSAGAVAQAFQPVVGLVPAAEGSGPGAAIVTAAAAQRLFEAPFAQLQVGAAGRPVTASWEPRFSALEFQPRNVIGILAGSDPALRGQYVLVGAHNDHVGMVAGAPLDHDSLRAFNTVMRPQGANDRPGAPTAAQQRAIDSLIARARAVRPPRGDSVMNGADDDASGTAVLLEIAERFATEPAPARSLIFISHAYEEGGLYGSEWFVEHPTVPLDAIVAAHNMDMVGNGAVTDVRFGGPAQVQMLGARRLAPEFGDMIDSLNAVRAETMAIDYSWDRTNALNRFCRSDQVSYFNKTIPVTYFSTGYSRDYHQATDEPQYLDYDKAARVGRFVHEIMRTAANRPTRFRILPPEERDLSARC